MSTNDNAAPPAHDVTRVATWNLDRNPQLAAERMIAAAGYLDRVEILLVQENQILPDGRSSAGLLAELAGFVSVFEKDSTTGDLPGTAVLSRHPFAFTETVSFGAAVAPAAPGSDGCPVFAGPPAPVVIPAMIAGIDHPSGRRLVVVSAHLAWGALAEPVRLRQAETIARRIDAFAGFDPDPAAPLGIIGMDANTLPDSATIRFLTGLDPAGAYATLFVDTFAVAGTGPGATSTPRNPYSARTAAHVGILRPELIPDRRIDFLLARGYVHGRPGFPFASGLLGVADGDALTPSDHYGVWSDLWLPPVP